MEGSLVESNSVLAPGTVLPPGRLVPSGQLWAGNPARFVRDLMKDEVSPSSPQGQGICPVTGVLMIWCLHPCREESLSPGACEKVQMRNRVCACSNAVLRVCSQHIVWLGD